MKRWLLAGMAATFFNTTPVLAQDTQPETPREGSDHFAAHIVQRDLDALYAALREATVNLYAYRSKASYDAFYRGLRAGITGPMSRLDAAVLFQRLAAFAQIGHIRTNAHVGEVLAALGEGATFAPIFIRVERDGRVFLTDPANIDGSAPAGAEVTAIDGEPIGRILARTRELVSAERAYMANAVLEEFFPPLLWIQNRDKEQFELELRDGSKTFSANVPTMDFGSFRSMMKSASTLAPDTDFNAREFRMIDETIGYLRPGPFSALEGEIPVGGRAEAAFVRFVDESFEALIESGASDLIIDLRNNSGGDNAFSDPMIAWFADRRFRFARKFTLRASAPVKLHYDRVAKEGERIGPTLMRLAAEERARENGELYPLDFAMVSPRSDQRFEGRVWVLVNRHSYSNATSVSAIIKDYGFGTIMGEETADVPTSFASIFPYTLPGTGFSVDLPKSYFIRPNGDETVRGVIPQVELPRQAIGSATDTMLESALKQIRTTR